MAVQFAAIAKAAAKAARWVGRLAALRQPKGEEEGGGGLKVVAVCLAAVTALPLSWAGALQGASAQEGDLPPWMTAEFVVAAYEARGTYGIPVSAGLLQMAFEAGEDISGNAIAKGHNYAGVRWAGQAKASGYTQTRGNGRFAKFDSDAAFLDYYYNDLLQQGNFAGTQGCKDGCADNDAAAFLRGLGDGGYCSGEDGDSYSKAVMALAAKYPKIAAMDLMDLDAALASLIGVESAITETGKAAIIQAAFSQLGVPYVWGGASPGKAMDCSGLTMWCYSQAGIVISHYTESQYNEAAQRLPVSQAEPGDILYHKGHVAVYIGEGKCIEAPHKGAVVCVSDVSAKGFTHALRF